MPNGKRCSPPKTVTVKGYWRNAPKRRRKAASTASLPFVVKDSRNGAVISRHRTFTAAVRARKRADLASYRRGQGRPYETGRAA